MKQLNDSKFKMCCKAEEHIKHIVAGCTTLAPSEYTNRHNKVAGYSHWMICKQVTDKYYEHTPARKINVTGTHYHVGCTCFHKSHTTANQKRRLSY
jgi:hypothetical protein